ncbi:TadE/TadG family type IV pilus assembly protein [Aurantiacibacter poecillastricola]|uniref:TadE/TadG family type IV pilus assembly protein n=1 Tax=Aurantiacibacter poecillastricola TaxID=3064385 RepID=UPI00273E12E2|nr:TadE/TadG family type IV pilus assembly protein [Aurantiacibacter sp. 219JJ12-13]MDP5262074.1 TadE/TadG family type IV pilus assembly protein [Aurantiacibacter sp. 219JJ12-13]
MRTGILRPLARRAGIRADERGSMAIETAFVAPVLLILALGGFEVSTMVARQTELQSAAAEAAAVVRAVIPETAADRTTVRNILATSTGLATNQITVTEIYRCGTATAYTNTADTCGSVTEYKFIRVDLTDTYAPIWTEWGVGSGFDYNVSRTVQIG